MSWDPYVRVPEGLTVRDTPDSRTKRHLRLPGPSQDTPHSQPGDRRQVDMKAVYQGKPRSTGSAVERTRKERWSQSWTSAQVLCSSVPCPPPQAKVLLRSALSRPSQSHSGQMRLSVQGTSRPSDGDARTPPSGPCTRVHMAWSARAEVVGPETRGGHRASGNKGRDGREGLTER